MTRLKTAARETRMGVYKCQLSVKIFAICQLSVKGTVSRVAHARLSALEHSRSNFPPLPVWIRR